MLMTNFITYKKFHKKLFIGFSKSSYFKLQLINKTIIILIFTNMKMLIFFQTSF